MIPAILSIEGGTLFLEGGILRGTGSQGIYNNSTIRGNGTIDAGQTLFGPNGIQIIGEAGVPGTVTVTGNYVLSATSILYFDVGGLTPGTHFDRLNIQGNAALDGSLEVDLINGFQPRLQPIPDEFDIITFAQASGAFDATEIDLGNGLFFDVDQRPDIVTLVTSS